MMQGKNHKNITALLESIEGLHALATDTESKKTTPSLVKNNEVVKLKTVFASRADKEEKNASFASIPEGKGGEAAHDENDFDAKLAKLIQDVVGNEPQAVRRQKTAPKSPLEMSDDGRKTPYLDASSAENSRDIRSEIDNLLAPYLDKKTARSGQQLGQNPIQQSGQNLEQEVSYKLFQKETAKQTNSQPAEKFLQTPIGGKNIRTLLSSEDLQEINLFIKQEIKKQISVWISQNIDQIIEVSLLSDRPDARNASGVTRAKAKNSG